MSHYNRDRWIPYRSKGQLYAAGYQLVTDFGIAYVDHTYVLGPDDKALSQWKHEVHSYKRIISTGYHASAHAAKLAARSILDNAPILIQDKLT